MGPSSRTSSKSGRETGLREYDFVDEMQIDQRLWIVDLASRPKSRRLRAASVVAIAAELHGGVAERLNAPVLKTGDGRPSVGSNPTPSAKSKAHLGESSDGLFHFFQQRLACSAVLSCAFFIAAKLQSLLACRTFTLIAS